MNRIRIMADDNNPIFCQLSIPVGVPCPGCGRVQRVYFHGIDSDRDKVLVCESCKIPYRAAAELFAEVSTVILVDKA